MADLVLSCVGLARRVLDSVHDTYCPQASLGYLSLLEDLIRLCYCQDMTSSWGEMELTGDDPRLHPQMLNH